MLFLLSGEGPTDLGECLMGLGPCDGDDFLPGPLTVIAMAIVERSLGYSPVSTGHVRLTTKTTLKAVAQGLAPRKVRVPGRHRPRETGYFYTSARALAVVARQWARETGDDVVAILYRDSDTSSREGRHEWQIKWESMVDGFEVEQFAHGVPLLPRPTSEAWLLCLLRHPGEVDCEGLEERSSSPKARNPLKRDLEAVFGRECTRENLTSHLMSQPVPYERLVMPSFLCFREKLQTVLEGLLGEPPP